MKRSRSKRRIQRVVAAAFPNDAAVAIRHIEDLCQLSLEELENLMSSDHGMRRLQGPLCHVEIESVQIPKFSEVAVAKPGRLTRLEHARVLSGGTRDQWGPYGRRKKT